MESVRKHSKMLDWQVKQIKEPFKDFAISEIWIYLMIYGRYGGLMDLYPDV